jgi:hypothetical protein
MKYRLTHTDAAINEMLANSNLDVVRKSLRDYETAIKRGEGHEDAMEYVKHRFMRFNPTLVNSLLVEVM